MAALDVAKTGNTSPERVEKKAGQEETKTWRYSFNSDMHFLRL
jgi:hypothetical protein